MVSLGARPVANKLHPANHLTDGEESNDLGRDDTRRGVLGRAHVPQPAKDVGGLDGARAGVLQRREEGLVVLLEDVGGPGELYEYRIDGE